MRMFPEEEYVREEKRNSMREASGGKTISPPFHENPSQGSVCMFLSSIRKSVRNILSGFTSGCGLSVRMVMNPPWPPAYNSFLCPVHDALLRKANTGTCLSCVL